MASFAAQAKDFNSILFGREETRYGGFYPPFDPALTPADAYAIDTKLDDGLPGTGVLLTYCPALNANCASSCTSTATYLTTQTTPACREFIKRAAY